MNFYFWMVVWDDQLATGLANSKQIIEVRQGRWQQYGIIDVDNLVDWES